MNTAAGKGTHAVTAADSIGDRGETLSADEAVMTAHYRDEVAARSAAPFQLFVPRKTARRNRR